jgi:PAS domain S-box-containing protein
VYFLEKGYLSMRQKAELIERVLLAFVLLILGSYMGWDLYSDRINIESRERERLETQARVVDENLGRQLVAIDNALLSLAHNLPSVLTRKDGLYLVNLRLQTLSESMPGVRTLFILDEDGKVIACNRDELIGKDADERAYFKVARESNDSTVLHVSSPIRNTLGTFSINLVRSISGRQGRFGGLVAATLDPDYFTTLFSSVNYAPDMWTSLVHADGTLFIMIPEQKIPIGEGVAKAGSLFVQHMESGQTATLLTGRIISTGEERMVARRTVRIASVPMDYPLVVAVTRNLRVLYAPWGRNVLAQSGLFVLLVMTSGGGLLVFQERRRSVAKNERKIVDLISYQRAILASTPIGISVLSADCHCIDANDTIAKIFQFKVGDLIGKSTKVLYRNKSEFLEVRARAWPVVAKGGIFQEDVLMRRRDGSDIWVRQVARLVDLESTDSGVILTMQDITERKGLELELTRSNAELQQFASIVSHDLRQPLSMVRGYLGLLEKRLGSEPIETIKTYIELADAGTKHMDRLIFDVLEYSRAGHIMDLEPVSLGDAVNEALRGLQAAIRKADADITVDDVMPTVTGDKIELVRLFDNLIGNALKYRSPDRLLNVDIGYRAVGHDHLVWVRDNGTGIASTDHERAFRIFQRLVPDDTVDGSGVGLAICKKIVERHNGKIWIESALDQGCAVMMTFPVIPPNFVASTPSPTIDLGEKTFDLRPPMGGEPTP